MNANGTIVVRPVDEIPEVENKRSVFLAGTIDNGASIDWQSQISEQLNNAVILNPRRLEWDSSWEQDISNKQFYDQVNWELDHLMKADCIFMYFLPGSQSPISLLELGLYADPQKMVVCCPKGFWRKGNVDIVCERHGITMVDTVYDFIELWNKSWA